jgi:hypothetical protein
VVAYETVIDEIEELEIDDDLKEKLRSIPEMEEAKEEISKIK